MFYLNLSCLKDYKNPIVQINKNMEAQDSFAEYWHKSKQVRFSLKLKHVREMDVSEPQVCFLEFTPPVIA